MVAMALTGILLLVAIQGMGLVRHALARRLAADGERDRRELALNLLRGDRWRSLFTEIDVNAGRLSFHRPALRVDWQPLPHACVRRATRRRDGRTAIDTFILLLEFKAGPAGDTGGATDVYLRAVGDSLAQFATSIPYEPRGRYPWP